MILCNLCTIKMTLVINHVKNNITPIRIDYIRRCKNVFLILFTAS